MGVYVCEYRSKADGWARGGLILDLGGCRDGRCVVEMVDDITVKVDVDCSRRSVDGRVSNKRKEGKT